MRRILFELFVLIQALLTTYPLLTRRRAHALLLNKILVQQNPIKNFVYVRPTELFKTFSKGVAVKMIAQYDCLELVSWFLGVYDNLDQHNVDLKSNKRSPKEGMHELVNVNISLHPGYHTNDTLIAAYRYGAISDHDKSFPFRFRLYRFYLEESESREYRILMKLFKPSKTTELLLQESFYNLTHYMPTLDDFEEIIGCTICWKKVEPKIFQFTSREPHYYGSLTSENCQLPSSKNSSMMINVKDELRVFKNQLWVNDRVYSMSGELLYGNVDNIPYKFKKISLI